MHVNVETQMSYIVS